MTLTCIMAFFIYGVFMDCVSIGGYVRTNNRTFSGGGLEEL